MIAKLKGEVQDVFDTYIILMVKDIGYRVEGFFAGYMEGDESTLYIHHHVREQENRLFGFVTLDEYKLFQLLISVSGVGPKAGMSMIGNLGVSTIVKAIKTEETSLLKAPGIGKKTAERVLIDMRSKLKIIDTLEGGAGSIESSHTDTIVYEAIEGLVSLGFSRMDIEKALEYVDLKEYNDQSGIIKKVLSLLSKK